MIDKNARWFMIPADKDLVTFYETWQTFQESQIESVVLEKMASW